ncbi:MAG: UDP-glucose 4-epimerase GalE [Acidobacteria bacterium]|nr:UDP-glucose 4-epimerase GalE [Acidobacteriota bacterium]
MNILVTGGAGYIGSVMTDVLVDLGHDVTVFDNLSRGHRDAVSLKATFVENDLLNRDSILSTMKTRTIEAVIHLAGDALVGESMENPGKYYRTNVIGGLTLLDAMRDAGVKLIVFSSTCAVYGVPERMPMDESLPTRPVNPYGDSKLAFERALGWFVAAHGFRAASLRYFNAAGAGARCGERHEPETHLIPLVLDVAAGKRTSVTIFGDDYPTRDGTCVRDYIHVLDLADAHVRALEVLRKGEPGNFVYNLGCGGDGHSIREVVECARRITGQPIPTAIGPRRPGDPPVLVASSDKARRELGWQPRRERLDTILESAWLWMEKRA